MRSNRMSTKHSSSDYRHSRTHTDQYRYHNIKHDSEETEIRKFINEGRELDTMFMNLTEQFNDRYRRYSKMEADILKREDDIKAEAKALAEEKEIIASWKAEALVSQSKAEKDLMEIKKEREELERASTDIAVQLAELRRVQRELKKHGSDSPKFHNQVQPTVSVTYLRDETKTNVVVPVAKRMKLMKTKDKNASNVSIRVSLQEDAPGLYEMMEEKGLVEDVKDITNVWDEYEEDFCHDDFKDLGAVISKMWPSSIGVVSKHRVHSTSSSSHKPNYCLSCLIALIEQTRLLRQRKWAVKWGWCRVLQAFIFVFERHNRIVVERPEYGYATYFFEVVQLLPVKWQVERLIKVMSNVTNCRAALLENRSIKVVGKEEREIMKKYGWNGSGGIGSLLNFCDRVSHDYKRSEEEGEERDSEWRCKIGELLMNGYDQGSILPHLHSPSSSFPVKLEN